MTGLDEVTRRELVREIALTLAKKQRLAFASDFHAFTEGRQLTLAGVTFEFFPKGPNTKRSDGDVVAHAIVMALAAAVNKGDRDSFPQSSQSPPFPRSHQSYASNSYQQHPARVKSQWRGRSGEAARSRRDAWLVNVGEDG